MPFTAAEISRYIKQTSNDDEKTVVVITVDCILVGRFIMAGKTGVNYIHHNLDRNVFRIKLLSLR